MAINTTDEQQSFERFAEALAIQERQVIDLMLTKKLGPLTDKERDRALSCCETDTYNHPAGSERRVFHCGEFLVGFSSRWNHDELQVAVKTVKGEDNALFCVSKRDYQ